ncbi:MAG TPA: mersacidin/lichenicidin family type 2 lantibiotic [Thermoanaerobaculia bacterium]|nr:mersacidin/lichenicidin family type 2 lantibiotic [Thermoanaerobaculia bacterium]
MKKRDVIRAWRDGEYYSSLSNDERAEMPESPASVIDLGDEVLATVTGGCSIDAGYCPTSTYCSPCPPRYCP